MKKSLLWMAAMVLAASGVMVGCKSNAQLPVNGTLENAMEVGKAPQAVLDVMKRVNLDDRYETLVDDKTHGIAVYSLLKCSDEVSSEGYGMVVARGDVQTALPDVRHGRMPRASYDAATGDLWIIGSDMEGTGVNVERPYLLRFGDDGYASVVTSIDPYQMQQALCQQLTYSIAGQDITFYDKNGANLVTVTNHLEDMGGFMDDAIYIGEQISYVTDGKLTVQVTPGVNFVVGKILHYDDMPTITATVTMQDDGSFTLGDFKVATGE